MPWPFPGCRTYTPVVITSPENNATVTSTPTITGTAAPNATIIALGNGVVATATANGDGAFTMTPTLPLGEITLTFYQIAVDCPPSPIVQLTLNVVAP